MVFDDWLKFADKVGVLSKERLDKLFAGMEGLDGLDKGYDDTGRFHIGCAGKLMAFTRTYPQYHIVTETSDHDELEHGGYTASNCYRYVNRMAYYLADGDSADHELVEENEAEDSDDSES